MAIRDSGYQFVADKVTYHGTAGLGALISTGPFGTPLKIVSTSAPYGYKVHAWTRQRVSAKPLLPHPLTNDPNEVLFDWEWSYTLGGYEADGQPIIRADGFYKYILKLPPWFTSPMFVGNTPIELPGDYLTIRPEDFDSVATAIPYQKPSSIDLGPGFITKG